MMKNRKTIKTYDILVKMWNYSGERLVNPTPARSAASLLPLLTKLPNPTTLIPVIVKSRLKKRAWVSLSGFAHEASKGAPSKR